MFDRFTDRARKMMALAHHCACRLEHHRIDTEHVLLGLLEEGSGVAVNALSSLGCDKVELQQKIIEKLRPPDEDFSMPARLPQTAASKRVIGRAISEARLLGDNRVGTEHILLALVQIKGLAQDVLRSQGISVPKLRDAIIDLTEITGTRRLTAWTLWWRFRRIFNGRD